MFRRVPVAFVVWSERDGRAREIAEALGGRALPVWVTGLRSRKQAPLRYIASFFLTLAKLLQCRPRAVIVTNPPVFAGLAVALYALLARVPFVLDSHPTSFGAKGHRVSQRLLPLHRWLARRSAAVCVTDETWMRLVASWGAHPLQLHEAPSFELLPLARAESERVRVLFPGIFGNDEPVEEILEAAQDLSMLDFFITGDSGRCSFDIAARLPGNVELTGYLRAPEYRHLMERIHIVLALSTEPTSVMRSAYEAVYAGRVLVLTDTPANRSLFPWAVFVDNNAASLRKGLEAAVDRFDVLISSVDEARQQQVERWNEQLSELRSVFLVTRRS